MKLVLTQADGRLEGLEEQLRACGFSVARNPLIATKTRLSDEARDASRGLLACAWLLFTSPAGVTAWRQLGLPFGGIKPRLGAVGEKTAATIERYGGRVKLQGRPQNARGLAKAFLAHPEAASPVGLPRGDRALPDLQEALEAAGIETRVAVVYDTQLLPWREEAAEVIILASPSAVAALPEEVGQRAKLVTLGPSTAAAARARGWASTQARQPSVEAVVAAVMSMELTP
jgi:uroporphyrinogen-III synthase